MEMLTKLKIKIREKRKKVKETSFVAGDRGGGEVAERRK